MKIVFLDAQTVGHVPNLNKITELGDYTGHDYTSPDEVIQKAGQAEIIITNKVSIDQEIIDQCIALQLICVAATGMDHIDVEYARSKGIAVKNVAGYSTHSVAQHTFATLLYLLEQLNYYDQYVKNGDYANSKIFTNLNKEFELIYNKKFGIIGMGAIGQTVASIADAFGSHVQYFSISGKNNKQPYRQVTFDELISDSDFISIHSPLTEKSQNLINKQALNTMKSSAILINMGRGGIVNEEALAEAIDHDQIGGAAMDVFEKEPIESNNPLLKIRKKDKLVLTPHIAWSSIESRTMLIEKIVDNIKTFLHEKSH